MQVRFSFFPLPPPILCFLIGLVMYLLPSIGRYARYPYIIGFLLLSSIIIAMAGLWQFHLEKANLDPQQLEKTTKLVTFGIFSLTRNPMYLSLLLILMVWALWLGHYLAWSGVCCFVYLMNRFQIAREERYLEMKFGETYRQYKSKVRRWS